MKKMVGILGLSILLLHPSAHAEGFLKEVAKGVAVGVLVELFKSTLPTQTPQSTTNPSRSEVQLPKTIEGSVDDKARVKAILAALVDTSAPIEERIGYYAPKVDYFSSGVVDHAFIIKDQINFDRRWPERDYRIVSIDEIAVDPNKKFAAARYTVRYLVKRPGDQRSGISKVSVLLGSFDVQPRLYSIKEWVRRD